MGHRCQRNRVLSTDASAPCRRNHNYVVMDRFVVEAAVMRTFEKIRIRSELVSWLAPEHVMPPDGSVAQSNPVASIYSPKTCCHPAIVCTIFHHPLCIAQYPTLMR